MSLKPDKKFMTLAIKKAKHAQKTGDYAVGACLVEKGKIISLCANRSKRDESPIAHAEVLAIVEGCKKLKTRHLTDCILYATHEPCPMCSSVIVWAKLKGVVYGAKISDMKKFRTKSGNYNYQWRTIDIPFEEIIKKSTENPEIIKNFMRKECLELFHN